MENLSNTYQDIVKDNMYLLSESYEKSESLLTALESKNNETDLEQIREQLDVLLSRMYVNLVSFRDRLSSSKRTQPHKNSIPSSSNENSSVLLINKNISLSLKKPANANNEAELNQSIDQEPEVVSSQETVIYTNLDEPEIKPELLEASTSNIDEKSSVDNNDSSCDLLKLIKEVVIDNNGEELRPTPNFDAQVTEVDVEQALAELDANVTSSSSDDDSESIVWTATDEYESDNEGSDDDQVNCTTKNNPGKKLNSSCNNEELIVRLKRLEDLEDEEINRLCNVNSINKRKLISTVDNKNKRNVKRKKKELSTTSTSGSTTPTLSDLDDYQSNLPNFNNNNNINVEEKKQLKHEDVLAEGIACHLLNDSSEIENLSSDSDKTSVSGKKEKKQKERKPLNNDDIIDLDKPKTNGDSSWRNDPLLRGKLSSSSSDSEASNNGTDAKLLKKLKKRSPKKIQSTPIIDNSYDILVTEEKDPLISSLSDTDSTKSIISCDNSSDSDVLFVHSTNDDEDPLSDSQKGRRNIRALLSDKDLTLESQLAQSAESERIKRLTIRSKTFESTSSFCENEIILDTDLKTNKPLIKINSELCDKLKPHQIHGVQFMWEACYESCELIKKGNKGSGCILAHCMGLGKTFQVITLLHTLYNYNITNTKHVLIICPLSTVLNWRNEFNLAFKNLRKCQINFNVDYLVKEDTFNKLRIIRNWYNKTGIIVMGYEAYEIMTNEKTLKKIQQTDQEIILKALVNPGPDLVVCDEGHLLKNGKTLRTRALMKIKTRRRIVLTGTPLQNNLQEYYYMVQFIKPHLLGTYKEYTNRFVNPIMNGQFNDSTAFDIKLMKKRTHVLNELLKKTIQRFEVSELHKYLPEIKDYAIFIKLHPIQIEIYKKYIERVLSTETYQHKTFLKDFHIIQYICSHPYTLYVMENHTTTTNKKKVREEDVIDLAFSPNDNHKLTEDWWKQLCPLDTSVNIEYGPKLKVMQTILEEAEEIGDKVLIFSASLIELNCIEHFLKTNGTKNRPKWLQEVDYFRMDGTVSPEIRTRLCNRFNSENNLTVRVFLISHKVGGLGLNLIAANRVILMGTNFNPCYDTQSIYRVYRFGQRKKCYVYRLITLDTMEEKIYQRCIIKLAVATRVVDKSHVDRHYKITDLKEMYQCDFDLNIERPVPQLPKDVLLAKLLQINNHIFKYHEHQALLENRPDEELNENEKQLAWDEFNNEQQEQQMLRSSNNNPPIPNIQPNMIRPPVPVQLVPNMRVINNPNNNYVYVPTSNNGLKENINSNLTNVMNRSRAYIRVPFPPNSRNINRLPVVPNLPIIPNLPNATDLNHQQMSVDGEFNYSLNKLV